MTVHFVLIIIAFVLVLMSALNVQAPRINLGWAGLAVWLFSLLIS